MDCNPYTTPTSPTSFSSSLSSSISAPPSPKHSHHQRPSLLKYKGVVPQPNGRWGAQLYQDNERVWIGTFDHQDKAAQAYDLAAIRFRGPQAITNFPIYQYTKLQLDFLTHHSKTRVINMIRNQTFENELTRFIQARNDPNHTRWMGHFQDPSSNPSSKERLFEKVVTPSDVGKLHRLVIPKHQAERYLPKINGNVGGMMLSFEDVTIEKIWRFKYCYWKSSQNYVLTKGWGEFVKDKGLQPGDSVVFYSSLEGSDDDHSKFFIDTNVKMKKIVKEVSDNEVGFSNLKSFRLFGVDICPFMELDNGEVVQSNGYVS